MTTTNLQAEYGIPAELLAFIDDGFLVPTWEEPAEKMVALAIPNVEFKQDAAG